MFTVAHLIVISIIFLLAILIFGPIAKRAGFSRWWALLMMVPLVNIIIVWVFAFINWPAQNNA